MGAIGQTFTTRSRLVQIVTLAVAAMLLVGAFVRNDAGAVAPDGEPFERTWARTDKPVADLQVDRTWMWGPEANTEGMFEEYAEGHNGARFVQYYDKSRMEITTDSNVPYDSPWFVTNGLLVNELMTGELQVGNNEFRSHVPASVNVAGDPDGTTGPTYAALAALRDADASAVGSGITSVVDRFGNVSTDSTYAVYGVTAAEYVPQTDHTVASVFWEFMTSSGTVWEDGQYVTDLLFENAFYATGYPVIEAYWTTVEVDDEMTDVLLQCFERRCLTYTPDNPDGWKVEAGNVGQHYYHWRYVQIPGESTPTPTATATGTVTPTETTTATATATQPDGVTTTGDIEIEAITSDGVIMRNMQVAGDIQMEGWELRTADGQVFIFPEVVVREGFYITVRNCTGTNIIENKYAFLYWGYCVDNYTNLRFYLYDSNGTLIDEYPDW